MLHGHWTMNDNTIMRKDKKNFFCCGRVEGFGGGQGGRGAERDAPHRGHERGEANIPPPRI